MPNTNKQETFISVLFTLCVAVPYLNYYELTFVVWVTAIMLTLKKRYSMGFTRLTGQFVAILLIAFGASFFYTFETYNYLKDITYLLKPAIGLLVGYQLCRSYLVNPLRIVVTTGFLISVAHLLVVVYAFAFFPIGNISDLRMYSGYFSDFEVYVIILLLFRSRFGLQISATQAWLFMLVVTVSAIFYFARTNFIQFGILYLAMKGHFAVTKRSMTILASLIAFVVLSYSIIFSFNPTRDAEGIEGFMYKVKNAPIETFKTRVDKEDWKDFNDNYRSYENILTIRQVSADGPMAVLFGKGLGSTIDLKREVWLQTSFMRYIPFLHNGFMTVFLKSGIVGLFIYFGTIGYFFRRRRTADEQIRAINLLFVGTGIFLIFSNWVFLGFYNLFDTKVILVGFLIAYRERLNKAITQ
ncbi:MAG TPA: hypothetical protein VF676_13330 [Flavobacterium sp.]|jgi:hypothetical protein